VAYAAANANPILGIFADQACPINTAWNSGYYGRVGSADGKGVGLPMNWQIPSASFWEDALDFVFFGYASKHPGGANFAFGDGSVHFLPNSVSTTMVGNINLLEALSTRAGGEVLPEGSY